MYILGNGQLHDKFKNYYNEILIEMINIKRREDCVGCNACVQICPKQCIYMKEDEQGFLYPKVELDKCIDCHLCEKVCPVINQREHRTPLYTYAAKNNDVQIERSSSSGGVFFALVEYVIKEKNGVVFGARFNEKWEVVHGYAETIEEAKAFMKSKYVQSRIDNNFKKAEDFLKIGRTVLFSGTPCQIAGLKLFLRKDWGEQLLTVDLVCHGVPSPRVWKSYLDSLIPPEGDGKNTDFQSTLKGKIPVITGINFRDKRLGWEKYGFSVHAVVHQDDKNSDSQSTFSKEEEQELLFEPHYSNTYMQGFLKNLYLRPVCYTCPAKGGKSGSDITLADFWGIQRAYPQQYREKFFSLVLQYTEESYRNQSLQNFSKQTVSYDLAIKTNQALIRSSIKPAQYKIFWDRFRIEGIDCIRPIVRTMQSNLVNRLKKKIFGVVKHVVRVKHDKYS